MKENLLKRHWNIIYCAPIVCGILAIVLSVVFNPVFVGRYISSDHDLEGRTIKNIYILEGFTFFIGLSLIVLSRALRVHSEKKEKIVTNFLMLCGSIAFTLVLLEIGLKIVNRYVMPFNRQRHAFFQYDDVLGWTQKSNKTSYFKTTRVQINSKGLRDEETPYQKPEGEFRVLFLGDSQLFGDGVEADETFVSLLETELNSVQAINAGVIGYGTDQQLLFLKREGIKYSPDLVIVAMNAYDFQDNISETIRSGYSKPVFKIKGDELLLTNVPVPQFDIVERINRQLNDMSYLYYFASVGFGSIVNRSTEGEGRGYDPDSILLKGSQMEDALAVTKRILKEIAQEGRKVNAPTVVVCLPYQMDFGSVPNYKQTIDTLCQGLDAYSKANDFLFMDIRSELAPHYQPSIYRDTMHFSAEGHQIVAGILLKNLIGLNLIPKAHRK
jgi:hypothetical protein